MEKLYLDLAIVLFFLAALILVSRTRRQITLKSKISFNLISVGLCFLSSMSLFTLIQNQMVEQFLVPTAAIAMVELVRLVLLVSGLVFVISGVSKWLPSLGIREEKDESGVMKIELLKRLGRVLSNSSSLDEFLRESLEVFADNLRITAGTVYALSTTKDSARLMASYGELNNSGGISEKFVVNPGWLEKLSRSKLTVAGVSFSQIQPNATGLCCCFPMSASNGRTFLYLLWTKDRNKAESFDPYILQNLTDSLNARLTTERLSLNNNFNRMTGDLAQSLRTKITALPSAHEMLRAVKTELQNYLPVDLISICLISDDFMGRRISIGQSGTVLNEVDVKLGPQNSYLYQVVESERGIYYKNITSEKNESFPELLSVSQIKSLIAVPLIAADRTNGVLTVGTERKSAFRNVDFEILNRIVSSFEYILNELVLERKSEVLHKREKILTAFANELLDTTSELFIHQQAVNAISQGLASSIVRLSTVDQEGKFLISQALINESTSKVRTPEHGHLILSLLLWHSTVQKNGNTVVIECQSGKLGMPDIEIMQVFSTGVKRVAIVPIKLSGRVLGMISLADDKTVSDSTLEDENILLVETIAAMTAVAMDARMRLQEARTDFVALAKEQIINSGQGRRMRSQLKSSLTSIMGSLDMIKSGEPQNDIKRDKFLAIIGNSARKMNEYLSD